VRILHLTALSLCLLSDVFCQRATDTRPKLTVKEARELVLGIPDALAASAAGRCPKAEMLSITSESAFFQLRSTCVKYGSGLIGNFTVDLSTGNVGFDIDKEHLVQSEHLNRLRSRLFARKRVPLP